MNNNTDPLFIPLVISLATALFTTAFALLLWLVQQHKQTRKEQIDGRVGAYLELAGEALTLAMYCDHLRVIMDLRTGLSESFAVGVGGRKPLESMEMMERFQKRFKPVIAAVTKVQAQGEQEGIDAAYRILEAAMDLMEAATARDASRGAFARFVLGERRSPQQAATFNQALERLGRHRLELVAVARRELGQTTVTLVGEQRTGEQPVAVPSA